MVLFVVGSFIGMGGHGYGAADTGTGGGHFVHMRGLPFRATENDIANVSAAGKRLSSVKSLYVLILPVPNMTKDVQQVIGSSNTSAN